MAKKNIETTPTETTPTTEQTLKEVKAKKPRTPRKTKKTDPQPTDEVAKAVNAEETKAETNAEAKANTTAEEKTEAKAEEKPKRTRRTKKAEPVTPQEPVEATETETIEAETKDVTPKAEAPKMVEPQKEEPQKVEPKKNEPQKEESKKNESQKDEPKKEEPKKEEPKEQKPIPPCPTLLIRNIIELDNAPQRQLLLNDQQINQLSVEEAEKRFRWIEGTLALVLNYDVVLSDTNIWIELLTGHTSSHSDPRFNARLQFERQLEFISKLTKYRGGRFMMMSETYEEIDRFATQMDPPASDADMKDETVCRNIAARLAKRLILSQQRENRLRISGIGAESHHGSFADPAIIRRCVELFAQGKKVLLLTNDTSVAIRSMGMCDDLQRTNGIDDETWDEVHAPLRPMVMTFDDLKVLDAYTRQYHFLQMAAGKQWMEDVPQQMEKRAVETLALWEEGFRPGDRYSEKKMQQMQQKQKQQNNTQSNQKQEQKQQPKQEQKLEQKQETEQQPVAEPVAEHASEQAAESSLSSLISPEEIAMNNEEQKQEAAKTKRRGGTRRGGSRKPKAAQDKATPDKVAQEKVVPAQEN